MFIINTPNIEQAKNQLKKAGKPIIVYAQDDNFNRKILEYGRFDVLLFSLELLAQKKDKIKQLDTALNHVLAEIAAKNKVAFGFNLEELRNLEKKEKAIMLTKIRQNIKLCRKAKTKVFLLNYKDKINAFNFLISIGSSTLQAKQSVQSLFLL